MDLSTVNLSLYFICLFKLSLTQHIENNVCATFRDYKNMRNNSNCWYNFAAEARVPEIIMRSGYPFQEYRVQTKDGYILTVFRIPGVDSTKEPVFLMHGVQSTSAIFVSLGRNSLAFLLADAGHDVWMGNYRGTEYSEQHISMNIKDKEYWNYGADEIGVIDVPTMLNLVSQHTGRRGNIVYIGHSLGTTASMMYATEYPEHARRTIKLFIWLSPAYKLQHIRSPYRALFSLLKPALRLSNDLNVVQVVSRGYSRRLTKPTCLASPAVMLFCLHVLNLYLGPSNQLSAETVPVYFNQLPGGTSLKTIAFITESAKGKFKKYDYGPGLNMVKYGSDEAPEYNLTKITVPAFIYYSRNDWATPKADAINLYKALPKSMRYGIYEIPSNNFNHFDFCFGRNAKKLLYDHMLKLLSKVSESDSLVKKTDKAK